MKLTISSLMILLSLNSFASLEYYCEDSGDQSESFSVLMGQYDGLLTVKSALSSNRYYDLVPVAQGVYESEHFKFVIEGYSNIGKVYDKSGVLVRELMCSNDK